MIHAFQPQPFPDSPLSARELLGSLADGLIEPAPCEADDAPAAKKPEAASLGISDPAREISGELLHRASKGDAQAGKEIVESLHPMVSRLVKGQIRRHADLEDVVQEVFLKVFAKLHQFRGPQPFSHWVSRLSVTTCYDWLRRQKARPAVMASDLSEPERHALEQTLANESGEASATRSDLMIGLLDRLIASLKPQEQIVIRLLDLEERAVAEVSELTGWGHSKIKVTAFRARKKLSSLLQSLDPP
ncbi:RNA polymerase sigma factor [Haloferula sp. BvORR071]|uniref:RNA polymerase sigma factor n=1 Tax=Haloferula sp. BvORR071 TaxID=1396141 RepID=UPI000696BB0B|nr:RNA polymerase sigma factor [Haloferula sp. BvORR071]